MLNAKNWKKIKKIKKHKKFLKRPLTMTCLCIVWFIFPNRKNSPVFNVYIYLCMCQVEYSQRYAETNPQAQSLRHLLSEAHLLLRASLLQASVQQQNTEDGAAVSLQTVPDKCTDRRELEEALRQNCAQLGDCFSR